MKKTATHPLILHAVLARLQSNQRTKLYHALYAWVAVAITLTTSWQWARLGAQTQQNNADQIVNAYLFESVKTFTHATFPDQHTFLFKWPIFILVEILGGGKLAYTAMTIALVLLTVGLFMALLYRIERRPLLFGTICLALASCLLLVPAQPYPGALLPVNMAMITTRNLEYIALLASFALLASTVRYKSWHFVGATAILLVLIASDKLFLPLTIGGAIVAGIVYWACRAKQLRKLSVRWLVMSFIASVGAFGLIALINASGITTIQGSGGFGPYDLAHDVKTYAIAGLQMLAGIASVLGISPVVDSRILRDIPSQYFHTFTSWQGIAYAANTAIAGAGIAALFVLFKRSFGHQTKQTFDVYYRLSIMLIWTSLAACFVFVVTDHYYPVDARYLAIVPFTLFVGLALASRGIRREPSYMPLIGILLMLSTVVGISTAQGLYFNGQYAMNDTIARNDSITKAIKYHPVTTVVGDYWRVMPVRLASNNTIKVSPLGDCLAPSGVLNSTNWKADTESFAYLLTSQKSITGFGGCSLDSVVKQYGRPNASALIAGSVDKPDEVLLFYDRGLQTPPEVRAEAPGVLPAAKDSRDYSPSSVVPIDLAALPNRVCKNGTVMNIVAHQDDDILFTNPDLINSIRGKNCIRTVYVTAGDAGADSYYWLAREQASEAAYDTMRGYKDIWVKRIVRLPGGQYATIATPQTDHSISLIFLRTPDGNVGGQGFSTSGYESLSRLFAGKVPHLDSVDRQSSYTADELTRGLAALMKTYQPTVVRTQADDYDVRYPDHSDHIATGHFTDKAFTLYSETKLQPEARLFHYMGYPIHGLGQNLSPTEMAEKEQIFRSYAEFDQTVCEAHNPCRFSGSYHSYLSRQYRLEQ